jgi:hypothetical protein
MARPDHEQARDNNDIPGRDPVTPAGPLALLQARIHYPIHPPPNGDVRVTNAQNVPLPLRDQMKKITTQRMKIATEK